MPFACSYTSTDIHLLCRSAYFAGTVFAGYRVSAGTAACDCLLSQLLLTLPQRIPSAHLGAAPLLGSANCLRFFTCMRLLAVPVVNAAAVNGRCSLLPSPRLPPVEW